MAPDDFSGGRRVTAKQSTTCVSGLAAAAGGNAMQGNVPNLDLKDRAEDHLKALHCILEAWEEGAELGIAPELMAYAALYTALTDLVGAFGEDHVAGMTDGLRGRLMKGEFTVGKPAPRKN